MNPAQPPDISAAPLRVSGLTRTFSGPDGKPFAAADRISFSIEEPGTLAAVTGPDGAGKTTLLRLLAGILTPHEGEIRVFGVKPDPENPVFTALAGYMPQKTGLYEELTVMENFALFGRLRGLNRDELASRFNELMALTGLAGFEERRAGDLSGGMKQKLGLACSLLGNPRLLILDEPTVGVDPLSRRELMRILESMRQRHAITVIYSTAYLDEAETADRVILLERGQIIADGRPAELARPLAGRTFSVRAQDPATAARLSHALLPAADPLRSKRLLLDAVPRGRTADILLSEGISQEALAGALANSLPPMKISARRPSLEDLLAARSALFARSGNASDAALYAPDPRLADFPGDDAVEARGLVKRFGSFTAVANTTFTVKRGEIFGLLGPNGAGKTTTFRMLCGLLRPDGGSVRIAGTDVFAARSAARVRVGYAAQKFSLYERLTARQNLTYFGEVCGVYGRTLRERIEALADELGLSGVLDCAAAVLPLGAKRELAFACALVHRPAILFLDEATSGADLAARRAFWRRIARLSEAGAAIVITTHFMEEAEYCSRILIQDAGRVIASGSPFEIRESAGAASIDEAFRKLILAARENSESRIRGKEALS